MMPCFDLVAWKCKLKSVRFCIIFNREKKSLRHVSMVAKFPDLNKNSGPANMAEKKLT